MDQTNGPRELAIKRLKEKRDFKTHVALYVAINVFLWLLWAFTQSPKTGIPWPIWPTLGWGVAIVIGAWSVFGSHPITEDDIRTEMERGGGVVDVDHDRSDGPT